MTSSPIAPRARLRIALSLTCVLLVTGVAPWARSALTQPVIPAAPAEPRIPATRSSLADFGAVPDGQSLNTTAFARAIAALADQGGGTLVVPSGIWLTCAAASACTSRPAPSSSSRATTCSTRCAFSTPAAKNRSTPPRPSPATGWRTSPSPAPA